MAGVVRPLLWACPEIGFLGPLGGSPGLGVPLPSPGPSRPARPRYGGGRGPFPTVPPVGLWNGEFRAGPFGLRLVPGPRPDAPAVASKHPLFDLAEPLQYVEGGYLYVWGTGTQKGHHPLIGIIHLLDLHSGQ